MCREVLVFITMEKKKTRSGYLIVSKQNVILRYILHGTRLCTKIIIEKYAILRDPNIAVVRDAKESCSYMWPCRIILNYINPTVPSANVLTRIPVKKTVVPFIRKKKTNVKKPKKRPATVDKRITNPRYKRALWGFTKDCPNVVSLWISKTAISRLPNRDRLLRCRTKQMYVWKYLKRIQILIIFIKKKTKVYLYTRSV